MKRISIKMSTALTVMLVLSGFAPGHAQNPVKSITAEELKGHIYFLASDFMNGRVGPSAEYEIAARYVGAQFAASGVKQGAFDENGNPSYFQGVPFAKTLYGEKISWSLVKDGEYKELIHKEDFKVLFGKKLIHNNAKMVYVGYGIEEPDHNWDDFKGLDVEGKIMICLGGVPAKNGKPVFPEDVNKKYTGQRGFQSKIMGLFGKGAEAIILVDIDGSTGLPFAMLPSQFSKEQYVYKGDEGGKSGSMPTIYLAKPEIFNVLMPGSRNNPINDKENIHKAYKPQLLENVVLNAEVELISEEIINAKNVIGIIPGTDPVLKDEIIVVGAHLDHVKPVNGQVCNGADDNASGSAGVMEIAEAIAINPCKRTMVFVTFTAEEMGLLGSRYFVDSDLFPKDKIKFMLNMDMIGRSETKYEETREHYVRAPKKYISGLETFINELNKNVTDFPLLYVSDEEGPGGSDHQSFISKGIPGFFFFSGMHRDLHQPGDDPDKIDYAKAESISKLAYLIANKLGNMETVPTFE